MKFSDIKEKLLKNKFSIGFEDLGDSIQAIVKSTTLDTDFLINIEFFDGYEIPVAKYKCTKTGKTRYIHYFYLRDLIDDYENFLEFLGALESIEKDYNHSFSVVKDIYTK